MTDRTINRWGSIGSIACTIYTAAQFRIGLLKPPLTGPHLSGLPKLQTVLFLGLAVAAAHGILWALTEKLFRWKFGGGGKSLPQGWSAAALSASMTIPLVLIPPLYGRLSETAVVPPGHEIAAGFIIAASALGHVLMYGVKSGRFRGIRNIVFPLCSRPSPIRAVLMEAIYAAMHFSSVVLIYRAIVASRVGWDFGTMILPVLISAALWLSCTAIFIFLKYPDSLKDRTWIEVRGIIHALMLCIILEGGMLM